jgi:hypothetical protein
MPEYALNFHSPLLPHQVVAKAWQKGIFEGWKVLEHNHGVSIIIREPIGPTAQGMVVGVTAEPDGPGSLVRLKMQVDVGNARSMAYLQRKAEELRDTLLR